MEKKTEFEQNFFRVGRVRICITNEDKAIQTIKENNMTILVTGSAGMIGGYVVKGLIEKGHTVIGVDRSGTGIYKE